MIEGNVVKIDVDADEAAKSFADALCDLISPATETLGLVGDAIRVARLEVAERIARKAKRIADENGLKLKAPPLKFLLPFFESGSLEDEPVLEEMWAGILASASSKFSSQHTVFLDIVRRVGPAEARAIRWLGSDINPRYAAQFEIFQETTTSDKLRRRISDKISETGSLSLDETVKYIESYFIQSNQIFVSIILQKRDEASIRKLGDEYAASGSAYETLRHLGLVRDVMLSFELGDYAFNIKAYAPTRLCVDFLVACEGGLSGDAEPETTTRYRV